MEDKLLILDQNMVEYKQLDNQLKEIKGKQDLLKIQNLSLMKFLGIEFHTHENLSIQLIKSIKKIGIDENKLIGLIGPERVNSLRIIPVDAVMNGIRDKTIPEDAKFCILTAPQAEYVMIRELKTKTQKIDISG